MILKYNKDKTTGGYQKTAVLKVKTDGDGKNPAGKDEHLNSQKVSHRIIKQYCSRDGKNDGKQFKAEFFFKYENEKKYGVKYGKKIEINDKKSSRHIRDCIK